jgi:hypothetical protein
MAGRRRLRSGLSVWLPDHRTEDGRLFARYTRAGLELAGAVRLDGSERLRVEVRRYAIAGVVFERAARTWADLVARRDAGRGRRPSERQVERAARRLGLADATLQAAAARLETVAPGSAGRPIPSPQELLAGLQEAQRGR